MAEQPGLVVATTSRQLHRGDLRPVGPDANALTGNSLPGARAGARQLARVVESLPASRN